MQDSSWQNLDRMNEDMSRIGLSSSNSPLVTRTERMAPKQNKLSKYAGKKHSMRKKRGPLDDLNNWLYCDPDAQVDLLPQPFRFINELLEEVIMRNVNHKIDEIDELKTNPSYEGNVARIQPSGAYEIDNILCFSQEENALGYVLAGDSAGGVYLLDIANKARLARLDTKEKKPIIDLKLHALKYGDKTALIFFVVYLGRFEVDCFMMFSNDLINLKKVFSFGKEIKPVQDAPTEKKPVAAARKPNDPKKPDESESALPKVDYLDFYPMRVAVSETLEYLAISYFNGSMSIFEVPYMPILKNVLGLDDRVDLLKKASTPNAPLEFDRAELNKLPPFNDFLRKKAVDSMEAIQVSIFPDPIYSCKCKTRFKPLAPELLMKDLIDQAQKRKAQLIEPKDPKDKKGAAIAPTKKPAAGPGGGKPEQTPAEESDANLKPVNMENTKIQLTSDLRDVPAVPEFQPYVFFQYETDLVEHDDFYDIEMMAQHKINQDDMLAANGVKAEVEEKLLRKPKKSKYANAVFVVWRGTELFEELSFKQKPKRLAAIRYTKDFLHFYKRINELQALTFNKEPLQVSGAKEYQAGGLISCCKISPSGNYLGLGFHEGASQVWNLQLRSYGPTLDKHSKAVTCIGFYKDWILVTGAKDGTVQMCDLSIVGSSEKSTFMSQKNFFTVVQKEKWVEEQNEVVDLIVTGTGIVFVIDKFKNGRAFSVFHGKKVFRAIPGLYFSLESLTGSKPMKSDFQTEPRAVFSYSNSTLIVKAVKAESGNEKNIIGSSLMIFKMVDIVIGIFAILQEFIKLGYDRNKILDVFARLSFEELLDPSLQLEKTKQSKTSKKNTNSYFSKRNQKESFNRTNSNLNITASGEKRSREASKDLNESRANMTNYSRINSINNNNTTRGDSMILGDLDDDTTNLDPNKTYKTIIGTDPAERMKARKAQKTPARDAQAATTGKLLFEDFSKVKHREPAPEEVYDFKEQAFRHLFQRLDGKSSRSKNVGAFMSGLQKDMEERRMKERREDLKKKINQKVPPKVKIEDFLTDKAI